MKKLIVAGFLAISFCLFSFVPLPSLSFKVPKNWPKPLYDFDKNPPSAAKAALGRVLFYDPILSFNNQISCASCHSPYNAFAHADHALSHGIDDRIGKRNAPALMNLAWQKSFMWDGAINSLDRQSIFPITHPDEMNERIETVVKKLQDDSVYSALFYQAFGCDTVSSDHLLSAIAQFMLGLISAEARYDSVMQQKTKFTTQEKKGYEIFKKNCNSCHTEPLFTNYEFENNGLTPDTILQDEGRKTISKQNKDAFKFKVPTLRNIEFSFPYMHDGRFKKLSQVLNHYSGNIANSPTLAKQLKKPIHFSSEQKVDLIAFLLTLTDKHFMFNQQYGFLSK